MQICRVSGSTVDANQHEEENRKLKRLLADSMLDNDALRAAVAKKVLTSKDNRCAIATMQARTGISQCRACRIRTKRGQYYSAVDSTTCSPSRRRIRRTRSRLIAWPRSRS